jgi:hypothetical protein
VIAIERTTAAVRGRPLLGGARSRWTLRTGAAVAMLVAAAVHAMEIRPHHAEWIPAGLFFAAAAGAQAYLGIRSLAAPSPALTRAAIAVNGSVLATWAVSRTVGMPFGPHAGVPEAVAAVDLVASAGALVAIVALLSARRLPQVDTRAPAATFAVAAVVVIAVTAGLPILRDGRPSHVHDAPALSPASGAPAHPSEGSDPFHGHDHG